MNGVEVDGVQNDVTEENSEIMKALAQFRAVAVDCAMDKYQQPFIKRFIRTFKKTSMTDEDKVKQAAIRETHLLLVMELFGDIFDSIIESEYFQILLDKMVTLEEQLSHDDLDAIASIKPIRLHYLPKLVEVRKKLEEKSDETTMTLDLLEKKFQQFEEKTAADEQFLYRVRT